VKMAAVYLFAARGYHGTSIRDIARLAGLTNAGVYHFVDSKEGLLVEIMTEGQELLQRVTEASRAAVAEPEDKLAHLVGTLVGAHGKNRMLSFVTDWEIRSLAPGSPAHETIRAMRKGYESLWEEVIAAGVARGRKSPPDQTQFAQHVHGGERLVPPRRAQRLGRDRPRARRPRPRGPGSKP